MTLLVQGFITVVLVLSVNLIVTIVYLYFLSEESRKRQFFSLPVWLQKIFVLLFVGPLFVAPFLKQARIPFNGYDLVILTLSLVLIIGGFLFIVFAFLKIGVIPSLKEKSSLISQGVYRIVRHPIYSGTIFAFLGLILYFKAFVSLLYFPVSVILYYIMTVYEEKSLIEEYGQEYIEYQQCVRKRIIPFVL